MQRRIVVVFLAVLMFVGSADILAKRGGSSRSSTRSSTKSTKSVFKPKPKPAKKVVAPKKTRTDNKSTIKKVAPSTKQKPKAVSKNKMDRKQTKAMKSKNAAAGKKYGNKANAAKAYKADMAKKHTQYRSSTPPKTRPASVPQSVNVGGASRNVTYVSLGGGMYGYGYMDPVTSMYVALAANQMVANDMALRNAGYGHYNANGTVVVYRNTGAIILWSVIGMFVLIVIIAVVVKNN